MTRALPWLTFALGVLLTVGAYEGVRAVSDTYRALQGSSAERDVAAAADAPAATVKTGEARLNRKTAAKSNAAPRERRAKKPNNARRERLKGALERLSPDEREALKTEVIARREVRRDKRQNRAEEKREKRQALLAKVRDDMARAARSEAAEGEDVVLDEEAFGLDEEAMLEALEEELLDTAEPPEE